LTVRAYVQSGLWDNAWKHFKIVKKSVNVYKWAA
jgi:hypothetical protein